MPHLSELYKLEELREKIPHDIGRFESLASVEFHGESYPIHAIILGPDDPTVPTLGLIGGVHGLERVGSQLVLSYVESLFEQLTWDRDLKAKFKNFRLLCIPIVNPVGMNFGWRSNGEGVDLMRNAPVEADEKVAFLVGGHRFGRWLPWYRGENQAQMQLESQTLVDFIRKELFPSKFSMLVDVHSGFGVRDRLWFPYARSTVPFPRLGEVEKFKRLVDANRPHHIYKIEPQSLNYTTNGDLWDYMFDLHMEEYGLESNVFIPWTLEMGSWMWVKKNPLQLFSAMGPFNPIKEHRFRRVMRRHKPLFDLYIRAIRNHKQWLDRY